MGVVSADYQFELQLLRYQNPSHRLGPTARCCDSDENRIPCIDPCDNTLHLCLSRPGQTNCSLGQLSTGSLHVSSPQESDLVIFSTGGNLIAKGVRNPLIFTGYEWPVSTLTTLALASFQQSTDTFLHTAINTQH